MSIFGVPPLPPQSRRHLKMAPKQKRMAHKFNLIYRGTLPLITRKVLVRFQAVATDPRVLLNLVGSISPKRTKGTVAKPTEYPTMKNTSPTTGSHSRPFHGTGNRFTIADGEILSLHLSMVASNLNANSSYKIRIGGLLNQGSFDVCNWLY